MIDQVTQEGIDSIYGEDAIWKLNPFSTSDKTIAIDGPLTFYVEFDDVPPQTTMMMVGALVDSLNQNVPLNAAMEIIDGLELDNEVDE